MLHHLPGKEISDLPPGFGDSHLNHLKEKSSNIPRIAWKCPPKVVLSHNWHVAAGEESTEAEAQKVREIRVLEAVFPRQSAIPPSPSISLDVEEEFYNDNFTPRIPVTPIEEGVVVDLPSDLSAPLNTLSNPQLPAFPRDLVSVPNSAERDTPVLEPPASEKPKLGVLPDLGADVVTAASAAVTAIMKSMEKGSLIDTGLLVKILNDPEMIDKLINGREAPLSMTRTPMLVSKPVTKSILPSCPKPNVTFATSTDGNFHFLPIGSQPPSKPVATSVFPSCHKSTMLSVPMPANGSLQPPTGEVQPTVTRLPPQPDTNPIPGSKPTASISLARQQSVNISIPKPAVSNMYTKPDQVQSTVSSIPAQLAPKSFAELKPNPNPIYGGTLQANAVSTKTNPVKDINYIKDLIREHGSDKHNEHMSYNGPHATNHILIKEFGQNNLRPKFQKPCMYYRSPKGCRNGSNCPYQHDLSFQFQTGGNLEAPYAKRMKLDGEITGRT
ncbi:conserved hypothetical protein [Ricinus communis]|uniref:C3H1-type domain-containing protein n=2 Tax=Ricinus communis TaxID=3988 RepID=B9SXN1_RICCO|nr:conserved hypothetical protein [Ricinus communis]